MWFDIQKYEITDNCINLQTVNYLKYYDTGRTFKAIVAHCKEYGFIFPSSEIYDGLAAVYDYGQNGR
jgi:hypothetical protein